MSPQSIDEIVENKLQEFAWDLAEELREYGRISTTFLSQFSHHVHNPLTSVVGFLPLIQAGEELNSKVTELERTVSSLCKNYDGKLNHLNSLEDFPGVTGHHLIDIGARLVEDLNEPIANVDGCLGQLNSRSKREQIIKNEFETIKGFILGLQNLDQRVNEYEKAFDIIDKYKGMDGLANKQISEILSQEELASLDIRARVHIGITLGLYVPFKTEGNTLYVDLGEGMTQIDDEFLKTKMNNYLGIKKEYVEIPEKPKKLPVFVFAESQDYTLPIINAIQNKGFDADIAPTLTQADARLSGIQEFSYVIIGMGCSGNPRAGLELCKRIRGTRPKVCIIMTGDSKTEDSLIREAVVEYGTLYHKMEDGVNSLAMLLK